MGPQTYTLNPGGPYSPGQVVTVNYTLSSFTQVNVNWIIAFDINLGAGWTNLTPLSNPGNPNTNDWQGTGYWQWDTQHTFPSSLNFGPGWRFINTAGVNSDWGSSSTGPFLMSFQVTVGSSCTPQDLSIGMSVIGDCQTGGWSNGNCCSIVPYSIYSGAINSGITLSSNINNVSCYGYSDGSISLNISGGVPPYTYVWSNNSTNPSINNLSPGIYHVTVTDALNCTETINNLIVGEPSPISASTITNNVSCNGFSDGTASINSASQINSYLWSDGQTTQTATNLSAGIYSYTITDNNSCIYSDTVIIYEPEELLVTVNTTNESCPGVGNGTASLSIQGSTTPPGTVSTLSYCQSSSNTADFPGNQDAIIEQVVLIGDANNINNNTAGLVDYYEDYTATMYADITEGQAYSVDLILGDLSGSSYPTGAKVFIDYNIDGDFDDTGEEIGILNCTWMSPNIGSINFVVPSTGAYGATRMRVVSQDAFMGPTSNIGPCDYADPNVLNATPWFGATEDYSIVLNAPTPTASFDWSTGQQNTDSIYGLSPGTYTVIITPSNGCAVQDSATVYEPDQITFNPNITPISCNTYSDGAIVLSPGGGSNGPFTVDWGGINNLALNNGTYAVTVTDNSSNCTNDTNITLVQPAYFSVDFTTSDNEICFNDPVNLEFDFNQGGIAPFTVNYTVNGNAQSAGPFNNSGQQLSSIVPNPGNNTYIITNITDANGCINQNNINSADIYVNPTPDININVAPNPICIGQDAALSFTAPNGTPPYTVDYLIGGAAATTNVPAAGTNIIVSPNTTTTYTLNFVTDDKGCTANLTDNTTLIVNELPEVILNTPSESCDGDVIQLTFTFTAGVSPWYVSYSENGNPPGNPIPITTQVDSIAISPSSATTYTVNSITDGNGCVNNISQTVMTTINERPEVVLSGGGSICADGSTANVTFTISSGIPPYDLEYSAGLNSNFVSNVGNIFTISTDQSGIYTIQNVSDSKGCEATAITGSAIVNVNPLPEANFTAYPQPAEITDPIIHFTDISNGHISGIWNFSDGYTEPTNFGELDHTFSDTGSYVVSLEVESDSGCTDITSQIIIISPTFKIYIPNSFTPNNDLNNDYFLPIVDGVQEYEFNIYNRLGERVFSTNKTDIAWDGKINGEYAKKGVFVYSLILTDIKGKFRTYEGTLTLIR